MQVFPRHRGDELNRNADRAIWVDAEQHAVFAAKLRAHLGEAAAEIGGQSRGQSLNGCATKSRRECDGDC